MVQVFWLGNGSIGVKVKNEAVSIIMLGCDLANFWLLLFVIVYFYET